MNFKTITEKVAIENNQSEEETLMDICKQFNIYGEQSNSIRRNGNSHYRFFRPGYLAEITFIENELSVSIKIREGSFGAVMNDFHRLRGYEGSWKHILWSLLYDLSCTALLVFAITGVYMWWKTEKVKWIGMLFLLTSTGITAFTIWYLISIS